MTNRQPPARFVLHGACMRITFLMVQLDDAGKCVGHDDPCTAMLIDVVLNDREEEPGDQWYEECDEGWAIGKDGELTLHLPEENDPVAPNQKTYVLEVTGPLVELGVDEIKRRLKESKWFRDFITFPLVRPAPRPLGRPAVDEQS